MTLNIIINRSATCFVFWFCVFAVSVQEEDFSLIYSSQHNTNVTKLSKGSHTILNCTICNHHDHLDLTSWQFLPCHHNLYCDQRRENETNWQAIKHNHHMRPRKCRLELRDLEIQHSGIYRCLQGNGTVLQTFDIEVQGSMIIEEATPKVLSLEPDELNISVNSRLIIQCKVVCDIPPNIFWFKETENHANCRFHFRDKHYIVINKNNTSQLYQEETNVYLSKLNINGMRELDSGIYVCAAVTNSGYDLKAAAIRVIPNAPVYWKPNASFSLLFLIPLAFALVPITVWLCYYKKKKKKAPPNTKAQDEVQFIRRTRAQSNIV